MTSNGRPVWPIRAVRAAICSSRRVRQALEDVELGGELIRKGDRVHPINAAANRDPSRYPEPDSFRLDRKGWASHLTFNVGPRQCVGAADLAKGEWRIGHLDTKRAAGAGRIVAAECGGERAPASELHRLYR